MRNQVGIVTLTDQQGQLSCGYEFILYYCTMPMFMLWIGNFEGYISEVKVV